MTDDYLCSFSKATTTPDGRSIYTCMKCLTSTSVPLAAPPMRKCRIAGQPPQRHNNRQCIHLGQVIHEIDSDLVSCGCGAKTLKFYHCNRLYKPVTRSRANPRHEPIEEFARIARNYVNGYHGDSCASCKHFSASRENASGEKIQLQSTAVIVTCHNYARYLRQCLDSILQQSVSPTYIVLVDDASTDDTREIAKEYAAAGVRYKYVEFRDAAKSRNHGMSVTERTEFVLFVDADNWLQRDYIEVLLRSMTQQNIGVAYCNLWQVGETGSDIGWSKSIKPFSMSQLRRQNMIDTCSLVRRKAINQVNGWTSNEWGLQDWSLWLRIADAGWKFVYTDKTHLNYRVHNARMSTRRHGRYETSMEIMQDSQLITIVTLFCGREWNLDRWFSDLAALQWNHKNLHLVAVDNSRNAEFNSNLRRLLADSKLTHTLLEDHSRITEETPADRFADTKELRISNTYQMNTHLARLYSLAARYVPQSSAYIFSLEDDIGFPSNTLEHLGTEIHRTKAAAVSGCLRSRFDRHRLTSWITHDQELKEVPTESVKIVKTGFYCLLLHREAWDNIAWRPGVTGNKHPYYDWAACADIEEIGPIYSTTIRCIHWQANGFPMYC